MTSDCFQPQTDPPSDPDHEVPEPTPEEIAAADAEKQAHHEMVHELEDRTLATFVQMATQLRSLRVSRWNHEAHELQSRGSVLDALGLLLGPPPPPSPGRRLVDALIAAMEPVQPMFETLMKGIVAEQARIASMPPEPAQPFDPCGPHHTGGRIIMDPIPGTRPSFAEASVRVASHRSVEEIEEAARALAELASVMRAAEGPAEDGPLVTPAPPSPE